MFIFIFGPWAHLWRVSNLGLEPCLFLFIYLFYRVFESFCVGYLFRVKFCLALIFIFILYLIIVKCLIVICRVVCIVLCVVINCFCILYVVRVLIMTY